MHPSKAVAILHRAPTRAAILVHEKTAIAVTLSGDNFGSCIGVRAHVQPVRAADIDYAVLLAGHYWVGLSDAC
jgi:hypothetical protein